jgi:hypothetical protein
VFGVEALPLVHSFAVSDEASQRAVFLRIYLDLLAEQARGRERLPEDWFEALQACLAKAAPPERDLYLAELAKAYLFRESRRAAAPRPSAPTTTTAQVAGEEIEAVLRRDRTDELVALAADRRARLRPEHIAALAPRAREMARRGDRRLADVLLTREPIRLEMAALFLEATSEQRRAILLAAQRAELGRRPAAGAALDEETAGRLEFAAIAGDAGDFAQALAAALGVAADLAERIAADPAGEPLAVALVAIGAPRDLSVRIMTARDMREGEGFPRIHALARFSDRLSVAAAQRVLEAMLGASGLRERLALPGAARRQAANPSPFLRREGRRAALASPETTAPKAPNSQRP